MRVCEWNDLFFSHTQQSLHARANLIETGINRQDFGPPLKLGRLDLRVVPSSEDFLHQGKRERSSLKRRMFQNSSIFLVLASACVSVKLPNRGMHFRGNPSPCRVERECSAIVILCSSPGCSYLAVRLGFGVDSVGDAAWHCRSSSLTSWTRQRPKRKKRRLAFPCLFVLRLILLHCGNACKSTRPPLSLCALSQADRSTMILQESLLMTGTSPCLNNSCTFFTWETATAQHSYISLLATKYRMMQVMRVEGL